MKITAGRLKGRVIKAPAGDSTRPALARVRQALFDTLRPWLEGSSVLDLFAGSGAFLFEALSRGATGATGVDLGADAIRTIKENARAFGVDQDMAALHDDALLAIPKLAARGARFDVIAIAPPYFKSLQERALALVDGAGLLAPTGVVVVQCDRHEGFSDPPLRALTRTREKTYGRTAFYFYEGSDRAAGES